MLEAPVSGEGKSIVAGTAAQQAGPSSDCRFVFLQFHQRFRVIFDYQFFAVSNLFLSIAHVLYHSMVDERTLGEL